MNPELFVTGTISDNTFTNDVWSSGIIDLQDIILLSPGEIYTVNLNISPDVSLDDGFFNGDESVKLFVQGAASPLGGFGNNGVNYSFQFTGVGGGPLLVNPVTGIVSWSPIGGSVNVDRDIDLINGGEVVIGGIQLTLTNVHPTNVWAFSGLSVGLDADDAAFVSPWWLVRNANDNDTPNYQMMQGFGDGIPANEYDFHEGIDILASGNGDEKVVAVRPGKLIKKGTDSGGFVTIEVDVGGGKFEYDRYLHIEERTTKAEDDMIAGGERIGQISTTAYPEGSRHLHYEVLNRKIEHGLAAPEETYLNPFLRFTDNADRDPLGKEPQLQDTNNDQKTLIVAQSGQAAEISKQPIKGDVDLIADVRDPMHDTLLVASAPHKVGYWVKALFDQGVVAHGVKTAEKPYILSKFDDNWFADKPFSNGKYPLVYDVGRGVNPNPPNFQFNRNFIVTNTQGEDGRVENVVDEFWNTNAEDDGQPDTVAHANYAGEDDADVNAEARFKDGEYEVHIILQDLVNPQVDAPAGKLRLDNFPQKAGAMKGGGQAPAQVAVPPLYDLDNENETPYVPDFKPEVSIAKIDTNFFLDDPVGIFGDEYYPDLLMPAYIFPHKSEGWMEDDPFGDPDPSNKFIAEILVQSDGNGIVPLTKAWTANKSGLYDVIIDYDRDGLFTWTMDGLSGFKVLEKLFEVELRAGVQGSADYEGAIGPNGANVDKTGQIEIDWTQGPINWNLDWDKNLGKANFSAAGQTISFTDATKINKDFNVFKLVASAQVNGNVPAGSSVNLMINTINSAVVGPFSIGAVAPNFQESISNIFSPAITTMSGTAAISGGTQKGRSSLNLKLKAYDPPLTTSDPLTGQNVITGTSENDAIMGTPDEDLITGGQGHDRFVFLTPHQGVDTITDFAVAEDTLAISASAFGGGLTEGLLSESQFILGTTATTENNRFVYNSIDGILSFDGDGTGALSPQLIGKLSSNLDLSYQQFVITA